MSVVDVTSDANWAGCRQGRKSTSGATIMIGSHLIRTYSKTQSVIAKSLGDSELYAVVRASTEGLGILTLLKDFGVNHARVRLGMDASAAIGMAQPIGRQGEARGGLRALDPGASRAPHAAHQQNPRAAEPERPVHQERRRRIALAKPRASMP